MWLLVWPAAVGASDPRPSAEAPIVNGLVTPEFPSAGALLVTDAPDVAGQLSVTCSGTLIGCATFLTAAHCVCPEGADNGVACLAAGVREPSSLTVFLPHAGFFEVAAVVIDPAYELTVASDAAILTLASPVSGIAPSRINTVEAPAFGTAGTIVGFGSTGDTEVDSGVKRFGKVTTTECPLGVSDSTHVCWSFVEPLGAPGDNSGTCDGDSGGPLFANVGAGDLLVGLASGNAPSCSPSSTGFDTDIFYERIWIQTEAGTAIGDASCGGLPSAGGPGTQVGAAAGVVNAANPQGRSTFEVLPGTTLLRVALNGADQDGSVHPSVANDFNLYVKAGTPPSATDFDCGDARAGPYGFCEIDAPPAGTWHVLVDRVVGGGAYQATATAFGVPAGCVGDCNGNGEVTIDEIIKGVNIALGSLALDQCPSFDANGDDVVTVNELIQGVNNALNGCPAG